MVVLRLVGLAIFAAAVKSGATVAHCRYQGEMANGAAYRGQQVHVRLAQRKFIHHRPGIPERVHIFFHAIRLLAHVVHPWWVMFNEGKEAIAAVPAG